MRGHALTAFGLVLLAFADSTAADAPASGAPKAPVSYERYCSSCHGPSGSGDGISAHRFETAATDFTRGKYKCRSTPSGSAPTEDDLRRSVRTGLFGTGMPGFGAVSAREIEEVVRYLEGLTLADVKAAKGEPLTIPAEPPDDAKSIQRGAEVYARLKCETCHGKNGRSAAGPGKSTNEDGSPAHPTDLTKPSQFKCGDGPARLFLTVMTGMDGTPMAGYSEVVEAQDAWDLVHFVRSLGRPSAR